MAKAVTYSLNSCVSCLPGQQDIESAISVVTMTMQNLDANRLPPSSRSYAEVQEDLLRAASELTDATNRVVASLGAAPHVLAEAVKNFVHIFRRFIAIGLELAYLTQVMPY